MSLCHSSAQSPCDITQFDTVEEATRSESLASRFIQSTWDIVKIVVSLPHCIWGGVKYVVTVRL